MRHPTEKRIPRNVASYTIGPPDMPPLLYTDAQSPHRAMEALTQHQSLIAERAVAECRL